MLEDVMPKNTSPIVGKVCKHAIYTTNRYDPLQDLLTAKITNIHEDNTRSSELISIENFERNFYIVKEKYRKFNQKKDYIDKRLCEKYKSTQARLALNISKILFGTPDKKANFKQIKNNPYIFGCESSTPVIFKHRFFVKYPQYQETEAYTVAAYDVETNMWTKNNEVIMASITFGEKGYFAAIRSWYDGASDEEILKNLKLFEDKLLRETLDRRKCVITYELFDNETEVVENCIKHFHEYAPDYVVSWNAGYDMEKNELALRRGDRNLADTYSDPKIPKAYRDYKYDPGRTHKIKDNGDKQALEWQERFPTIRCPASWEWFDGASFYAIKRVPQGKKDSYSLSYTAEQEGVDGKLYTDAGGHLPPGTPDWHRYMQKYHKYEYSMYNIKDNIVIEDLNDKTMDYSLSLPMLTKSSEFFNYPSQPRLISDELSFIALEHGQIWGTRGTTKEDEFDKLKPSLGDWIALLETEKNADLGKAIFVGLPKIRSRGRGITSDIDIQSAYPMGTVALNVSNKTTRMEACRISGLTPLQFREIGVNYASSPKANAIKLAAILHGFPDLLQIEDYFDKIKEAA